jgi:CheY-like chemotaxis protein
MQKRILILDNDEGSREVLTALFMSADFDSKAIEYTDDIIKEVNNYAPDVLLLDYILNGINGGELCHQIKTNPATSNLPVVIVSAYPKVINSLGHYGCDCFIAKPFDIDDMLQQVGQLVTKANKPLQV